MSLEAAQRLCDSIAKNALSGLTEMAREDYTLLKRLSAKHGGREDFALLLAHGAFVLAMASDWDIAGGYIEDMENLRQRHPMSSEIAKKEIKALQYMLAAMDTLPKDALVDETMDTIRNEIKRIEGCAP